MTLGDWLSSWLELYVEPAELASNTKKCYNRAVRAVPPNLLAKPLQELTALDLRRWLLQVAAENPRAAQLDRGMLRRSLTLAAKAGMASPALCDSDLLPQIAHKPRKAAILTADQLRVYMRAASQIKYGLPLMLMACGLRRSEALGVRWEAVDLAAGTLAVVGQRLPGTDALSPCKSAAAYRVLELPPQLKVMLRRMPRPISGGWLCDVSHRQLDKWHKRLLADLNLPAVTLHGLRHSFATAAVGSGVPIKVLQVALGHAKYQLTADLYADHLPPVNSVCCAIFSA